MKISVPSIEQLKNGIYNLWCEENDYFEMDNAFLNALFGTSSGNPKINGYYGCVTILSKDNDYKNNLVLYKSGEIKSHYSGCINPIMMYEEVKDSCKIIKDEKDYMIVEFGEAYNSQENSFELERLKQLKRLGEIEKTNEKYTIFMDKDGNKTQVPVYLDKTTNKKFIFFKNVIGDFDNLDIINEEDIGEVENRTALSYKTPMRWFVQKSTGLMMSEKAAIFAEAFGNYSTSKMKDFIENDFLKEIGVEKELKKEEKPSKKTLWNVEPEKVSLKEEINAVLNNNGIPYLVGHPGVGKTAIAKSINKNYLSYDLPSFQPDRFSGKTALRPGITKIYKENDISYSMPISEPETLIAKPDWYLELIKMSEECAERKERCLLFLDEFDKLDPKLQVYLNGIVSKPRNIANLVIPDNVDIILAGNTEEYSEAAHPISGEVLSRLTTIEVKPDSIDWLNWASKNDVDPLVRAYLYMNAKDILVDIKDEFGEYNFQKSLTPRSWDQKISAEIKRIRALGPETKNTLYLHMEPEMLKKFNDFMIQFVESDAEEIVKGEDIDMSEYTFEYAKIGNVVNYLTAIASTEEELENVFIFLNKTGSNEYKEVFKKLWIKINNTQEDLLKLRTAEKIANNKIGGDNNEKRY